MVHAVLVWFYFEVMNITDKFATSMLNLLFGKDYILFDFILLKNVTEMEYNAGIQLYEVLLKSFVLILLALCSACVIFSHIVQIHSFNLHDKV